MDYQDLLKQWFIVFIIMYFCELVYTIYFKNQIQIREVNCGEYSTMTCIEYCPLS